MLNICTYHYYNTQPDNPIISTFPSLVFVLKHGPKYRNSLNNEKLVQKQVALSFSLPLSLPHTQTLALFSSFPFPLPL